MKNEKQHCFKALGKAQAIDSDPLLDEIEHNANYWDGLVVIYEAPLFKQVDLVKAAELRGMAMGLRMAHMTIMLHTANYPDE